MKTILTTVVLVLIMFFGHIETQSQQFPPAASAAAESWKQLGLADADFATDRAMITVTSGEDIRKLKFKVYDAPLEILYLNVYYGDDVMEKFSVNATVQPGGESPVINLKKTERSLIKVEFYYRPAKIDHQDKARVTLLGSV